MFSAAVEVTEATPKPPLPPQVAQENSLRHQRSRSSIRITLTPEIAVLGESWSHRLKNLKKVQYIHTYVLLERFFRCDYNKSRIQFPLNQSYYWG